MTLAARVFETAELTRNIWLALGIGIAIVLLSALLLRIIGHHSLRDIPSTTGVISPDTAPPPAVKPGTDNGYSPPEIAPRALPRAYRTTRREAAIIGIAALALLGFIVHKITSFLGYSAASLVYAVFLGFVICQLLLAMSHRPVRASRQDRAQLDRLRVVALIPAYNEDPEALALCVRGFLEQTRRPQAICLVDDGSTTSHYSELREWFEQSCASLGIRGHWIRQENAGKRAAQLAGVAAEPEADIYVTVDSDSLLDRDAIAQSLLGFADPRVQSVAAVILAHNSTRNALTRMIDVFCVGLQTFERAAYSRLGAVLVNSGGCAFYRGAILRDYRKPYLEETFLGRTVHLSDDSMLTLFALLRGRAVQQPSAFAFTLMPETLDHHRRQFTRWMRGSFIRSGWRLRYLPFSAWGYWMHLAKWLIYASMTGTLIALLAGGILRFPMIVFAGLVAAIWLYCITMLGYLTIARSDQSRVQRALSFSMVIPSALWNLTFLRALRFYSMATVWRTGWGTRSRVEVRAGSHAVHGGPEKNGGTPPRVESPAA